MGVLSGLIVGFCYVRLYYRKTQRIMDQQQANFKSALKKHGENMYREGVKDTYSALSEKMSEGLRFDKVKFIDKPANGQAAG